MPHTVCACVLGSSPPPQIALHEYIPGLTCCWALKHLRGHVCALSNHCETVTSCRLLKWHHLCIEADISTCSRSVLCIQLLFNTTSLLQAQTPTARRWIRRDWR